MFGQVLFDEECRNCDDDDCAERYRSEDNPVEVLAAVFVVFLIGLFIGSGFFFFVDCAVLDGVDRKTCVCRFRLEVVNEFVEIVRFHVEFFDKDVVEQNVSACFIIGRFAKAQTDFERKVFRIFAVLVDFRVGRGRFDEEHVLFPFGAVDLDCLRIVVNVLAVFAVVCRDKRDIRFAGVTGGQFCPDGNLIEAVFRERLCIACVIA